MSRPAAERKSWHLPRRALVSAQSGAWWRGAGRHAGTRKGVCPRPPQERSRSCSARLSVTSALRCGRRAKVARSLPAGARECPDRSGGELGPGHLQSAAPMAVRKSRAPVRPLGRFPCLCLQPSRFEQWICSAVLMAKGGKRRPEHQSSFCFASAVVREVAADAARQWRICDLPVPIRRWSRATAGSLSSPDVRADLV
jgi:hypothetical protein